ncbi:MAG TPA: ABC transporter substrate-binding protein [Thermomicrobiales bacterium]|nr:ABC transporter substrate-binding protein [Thermomicrobiales bacterium]
MATRSLQSHEISRRTLVKGTAALGAGAILASPQAQGALAQDRPVLKLGTNAADIASLDPHMASGTQDRTIVDMIFNGLIRFAPGDASTFEPDIATELPVATEGEGGAQVWTFTLRDDVQVHATASTESYILTSADVLFSFEKAANPDSSSFSGNYVGWTFAAPDDATFTVTLETPVSETLFLPQVANYSGGYIVPQQAYEALGAEGFPTAPAGTGPFQFESYTTQQSVVLTANDDFFRGAPLLGGVEVRFVAEIASRESALLSGDLHVIQGLKEGQWVDTMSQNEGVTVDAFGVLESVFLNLDVTHEILQDPLVREAILLATNRENVLAIAGNVGEAAFSVVPPTQPGGLDEAAANEAGVNFEPNVERAMELLAEAGHAEGFELDVVSSEQEDYLRPYTVLQEELRQVGITLNVEVVQHQAMHDLIREGSNPIVIYVAFRPTADVYLTQFFTTDGGVTNFSHFTLDDQIAEARATTDPEAQAELWRQANIEIISNFAGYGIMGMNQVYARSASVDYGHELISLVQLYPGIDELTTITE